MCSSDLHRGSQAGQGPARAHYSDKQHFLPVSFGVNVGVPLAANSLYLNTGLKYTYLYSKIKNIEIASNKLVSVKEQHLHYLGIPIALSYHFVNNRLLKAYIAGGTTIEHGVLNNNTYKNYTKEGTIKTTDKNQNRYERLAHITKCQSRCRSKDNQRSRLLPRTRIFVVYSKFTTPATREQTHRKSVCAERCRRAKVKFLMWFLTNI